MTDPLAAGPHESAVRPDTRFDIGPVRYPKLYAGNTIPIRMSDGVLLSADVLRPGDANGPAAEPLPAIVNFTAYNKMFNRHATRWNNSLRCLAGRVEPSDRTRTTRRDVLRTPAGGILEPFAINRTAVRRGYVGLMVDVRGTGSSTGAWDFFSSREQLDYAEVVRWVREQPWCDGRVAVTGVSYGAIAALHTAAQRPEGLEAVFAIEAGENPPRELGLTGGVPTPGMALWILAVNGGKLIPALPGLLREGVAGQFLRSRLTQRSGWLGRAVHGNDDRRNEATAVTFTSAPFDRDTILTGPMNLHLHAEADGTDAFWSITVCDVHPDGTSLPFTRGALLSSLRHTDSATSYYVADELLFPHHPLTADSALPLSPGTPFDIDIEINPTEILLRTGHRLRIAVSRTSFPRHLLPTWRKRQITGQTVVLDPARPSYLSFQAVDARTV
ncbi:CocE/NonD family hydrolase [Nocardia sp. ET3-3]|uniref:CocE/NonD family hydrolase n=1 Tax=Nocardia terrae TaxID=2675851 RepID=A0A7K1V862_9NOCA|nr:CocE/NonD family hydrolase [Nocardia terrae]MVU82649.1 CocE/NonD family hydrolase [Nocardia terrae]